MIPRIYHPGALSTGTTVTLTDSGTTHIGKSLRRGNNAELHLFNGDGFDYRGHITSSERNKITVTITDCMQAETESPLSITLLQGICRSPRMDMLIQKSTELGVQHIVPVNCQRSVSRIEADRATKKVTHWQNIATSACEQCGRARIPKIDLPSKLTAALEKHATARSAKLLLDPQGTHDIQAALHPNAPVVLFIGPEGGLTDAEVESATDAGFMRVRLGPRILRTETAPITALSIIQFLVGDLK